MPSSMALPVSVLTLPSARCVIDFTGSYVAVPIRGANHECGVGQDRGECFATADREAAALDPSFLQQQTKGMRHAPGHSKSRC